VKEVKREKKSLQSRISELRETSAPAASTIKPQSLGSISSSESGCFLIEENDPIQTDFSSFNLSEEMMKELHDPAPSHSLITSFSRVVPHLTHLRYDIGLHPAKHLSNPAISLRPDLTSSWTRLSLDWGLRAEETNISVPSFELFQLLGGVSNLPESCIPSCMQQTFNALLRSLSTCALKSDKAAAKGHSEQDPSLKSQLLFDILLKLLEQVRQRIKI